MTLEQYCKERLLPELAYYDRQAGKNKRCFQAAAAASIVAAAAVPVIATAGQIWPMAALGGVASVVIALQSLFKWQENWLKFRRGHQDLEREKFLSVARSGPYASVPDEELLSLFVERVESLIADEHDEWQVVQREHPQINS